MEQTLLHRWFNEVWNQRRETAIDEMMAPDCIAHGIVGPGGTEIRGPAAFRAFFHQFITAFPDIRVTVEDTLIDGDKIAGRCSVTATHTGPGVMATVTNKPASFTGMCIVHVVDGRITEAWNNFDFLSMYQQLGMQLS